ncbi:hypothetical protein ACX3O0_06715 [Homoserinimonas sp. A447]
MLIAGSVDLAEVLAKLSERRPVFHSERDFQFAFAWQVQLTGPEIEVHLEVPQRPGVHLDLEFVSPDRKRTTGIELKYRKGFWAGPVGGQQFRLTAQSAHDQGRYGVVKDISRIEEFVRDRPGSNGAVIALTNDKTYWNHFPDSTAIDHDFHIHHGAVLNGDRRWNRPPASDEHATDLRLMGTYEMNWSEFSTFGEDGRLRALVVEIASAPAGAN